MRVKWGSLCNFREPFFKKGGPKNVLELIVTDCFMRKQTFIEIIIHMYRLASTEHEVKMTLML